MLDYKRKVYENIENNENDYKRTKIVIQWEKWKYSITLILYDFQDWFS